MHTFLEDVRWREHVWEVCRVVSDLVNVEKLRGGNARLLKLFEGIALHLRDEKEKGGGVRRDRQRQRQ